MYSQWGLVDGKEFVANGTAVRGIGELVALTATGAVTPDTGADNIYYPLKEPVSAEKAGETVDVQIEGVAKVYVEDADDIVAGSTVIVGPLGRGVIFGAAAGADPAASASIVGIAQKPAAGQTHIPVLLKSRTIVVA